MRRWIGILVLALLLGGCGNQKDATPTDDTTPSQTQAAEAVTCYETQTEFLAVKPMGENVLAITRDQLILLSGADAQVLAEASVSGLSADTVQIRDDGAAYFDEETGQVVLLDSDLMETSRFQLTEEVLGPVFVTSTWDQVYYCTASGIRVASLLSGISRNLMVLEGKWLGITGTLLNDSLLRCQMEKEDGTVRTILVCANTGETVRTGQELNDVCSVGDLYYYDGAEGEWIFGWGEEQPRNLWLSRDSKALPLLENSAVLSLNARNGDLLLDYYDLTTGRRTARVALPGISDLSGACAAGGFVWLFAGNTLYRWDTSMSRAADSAIYSEYRYTLEDPDKEALEAYFQRAEQLEETYGIRILMWMDPEDVEPDNYSFQLEYRPSAYEVGFSALEKALSQFPEGFLTRSAQWGQDAVVHICLVRGISATEEENGRDSLGGIQYLKDGNIYIVVKLDGNLEQAFYHCMGHLLDTLILSNSHAFDDWEKRNSKYFDYFNDYTSYLDQADDTYLTGENRYFIDSYSMSYAVEDRARIFEYAMMPGNEDCFTSTHMQEKLGVICGAIREVFDLEDGQYLWEQYLESE